MNIHSDKYQLDVAARILEIQDLMQEMLDTLEGCDWCCGGGDARWKLLEEELAELQNLQNT